MSTTSLEVADFVSFIETIGRRLYVADDAIDLRNLEKENNVYVLELADGPPNGGARGGGRERKVTKAHHYLLGKGNCMKVAEFEDEIRLEALQLPTRARAFPITLPDGREKVASGVADMELVASYRTILEKS